MPGTEEGLFRKSSLERVSSPEKLNEYIKVANPSLAAILAAIFIILAACGFWVFFSSIPKYVDLVGVAATSVSGVQRVYCYVPLSTARRLSEGMDVQISPDYASKEEYGYIRGTIIDVGEEIVSQEYLAYNFANPNILQPAIPAGNDNLVQVELSLGEWSSEKGKGINVTDGSKCTILAIEGEQKPSDLVFKA